MLKHLLWILVICLASSGCGSEGDQGRDGNAPEMGDELLVECPEMAQADGASCQHQPDLECPGSQIIETCDGEYGGDRTCYCVDGTWRCDNIFCASFCPDSADAAAGAACDGGGACYYDGGVLCTCASGMLSCNQN